MERTHALLPLLLALLTAVSPAETIRMATEARVWLKVPADAPPLAGVSSTTGGVASAHWEADPAARERHTDITVPVRWWSWNEFSVSFTPRHDGAVELSLLGPWGEPVDGSPPRQEVLWDDIGATGASLANGGFEEPGDGAPAGWNSPWAAYPEPAAWPLAGATPRSGSAVGAAFLNRPLVRSLTVRKDVSVTLTFHAMAAQPPGFIVPASHGDDTPAHRAASRMKRGVNLGNGWEATPGQGWALTFTTADIDRIADEGFDHIRVPIAWHFRMKDRNGGVVVDPAFLAEIEPVLRRALDRGLRVIVNWHHFDDLMRDPSAHRARFIAGWKAIARHFRNHPPGLFLELINEPSGKLEGEELNALYQDTVAAVRRIDPQRILFVNPGGWGAVRELDRLRLPGGDDRIVVSVHCYDPFQFTHQGAGWVGLRDLRGVVYPGPPPRPLGMPAALAGNHGVRAFLDGYNHLPAERNPCGPRVVREALDLARAWSARFGRPVHLGEFGAHDAGGDAGRARYLTDVRRLSEERDIPWCLWEWKAGFGYWDTETDKPRFRKALME